MLSFSLHPDLSSWTYFLLDQEMFNKCSSVLDYDCSLYAERDGMQYDLFSKTTLLSTYCGIVFSKTTFLFLPFLC